MNPKILSSISMIITAICCLYDVTLPNAKFRVPSEHRFAMYSKTILNFVNDLKELKSRLPLLQGGFANEFLSGAGIFEQLSVELDKIIVDAYYDIINRVWQKRTEPISEVEVFQLIPKEKAADLFRNVNKEIESAYNAKKKYLEAVLEFTDKDTELIRKAFLEGDKEKSWKLNKIWPADADAHKENLRVSFLEFIHPQNKKKIVVFKPSTVLTDFAIVGKLEVFCAKGKYIVPELCKDFQKSFFEVANEKFKLPEREKLQTIMILPIEDLEKPKDVEKRLKSAHGYIEFIPSDFSYVNDNILTIYEDFDKSDIQQLQKAGISAFFKHLEAERLKNNNNPLANKEIADAYWKAKFMTFKLLELVNSTDVHRENIISAGGWTFVFDLENSFSLDAQSTFSGVDGTSEINCPKGAIMFEKKVVEGNKTYFFAENLDSLASPVNAVKSVDNLFGDSLIGLRTIERLSIEKEDQINENTEKLFVEHIEEFQKWLDSFVVKNLIVRDIPLSTSHFARLEKALKNGKNQELKNYYQQQKDFELKKKSTQIFTKQLFESLNASRIPSYFIHVNQNELYFQNGTPVKTSPHLFEKPLQELKNSVPTEPYTPTTSWKLLSDSWIKIVNSYKKKKNPQEAPQEEQSPEQPGLFQRICGSCIGLFNKKII